MEKTDKYPLYVWSVCCLFILLCTIHYVRGRPLWLDELEVLRSIKLNGTMDFFTQPLQHHQIFPRVYLCLIQKISRCFGLSVWGLRFLSFISMLGAFAVWSRVGRLALKNNLQFFVFLCCWTASVRLIYYSAELKPYSTDVLAAGIFTWFLYRQESLAKELPHQKYTALLMLLPLLGLFSYPAFLFMMFPLYNLFLTQTTSKRQWQHIGLYVMVFMLVVAAVYWVDVRTSQATTDTQGFCNYALSFQSVPHFLRSFSEGTMNLFSGWFTEQPRYMKRAGIVFMIFGMFFIPWAFVRECRKKDRRIASVEIMALLLYFELLLLGALKKYPFTVPRTSLFYCPIVFLMTIKGVGLVKTYNERLYRLIMAGFMVFLLVVSIGIMKVVATRNLGFICFIW